MNDRQEAREALTKVPAVTLGFWIIKILATTLGETGGDTRHHDLARRDHGPSGAQRLSHRHRDLRRAADRAWSGRRSGRSASTHGSTGRRSSPRRPAARRSPTSPTARSASAIPAARCCCSPACCCRCSPGTGRSARVDVNTRLDARAPRPSTGSRSPSRRRSARRSATGSPMRASAIRAARWCSARRSLVLAVALFLRRSVSPRLPVLGGVHPHPPARRDGRRFPRQADRQGRPRAQPAARDGDTCGHHPDPDCVLPQRAGRHPDRAPA